MVAPSRCPVVLSHKAAKRGSKSLPQAAVQGSCAASGAGKYGETSAGILWGPRVCFLGSTAKKGDGFLI